MGDNSKIHHMIDGSNWVKVMKYLQSDEVSAEIKKRQLLDKDPDGNTCLHRVASRGQNNNLIRKMVEVGGEELLISTNNQGLTSLHCACSSANDDVINRIHALLDRSTEATKKRVVRKKSSRGDRTALHRVSEQINAKNSERLELVINELVNFGGTDLKYAKRSDGKTAHEIAEGNNASVALKGLLEIPPFPSSAEEWLALYNHSESHPGQCLAVGFLFRSIQNKDVRKWLRSNLSGRDIRRKLITGDQCSTRNFLIRPVCEMYHGVASIALLLFILTILVVIYVHLHKSFRDDPRRANSLFFTLVVSALSCFLLMLSALKFVEILPFAMEILVVHLACLFFLIELRRNAFWDRITTNDSLPTTLRQNPLWRRITTDNSLCSSQVFFIVIAALHGLVGPWLFSMLLRADEVEEEQCDEGPFRKRWETAKTRWTHLKIT